MKPAEISSFAPAKGAAGNLVNIIGKNFGEDSLLATVSFNGKQAPRIISYADTLITAEVPSGSTTGKISFSPASFVIGNKGYVAGGGEECWAYDPATDNWTKQAFIRNIIAGRAFAINNKGYFLTGTGGGGSTNSNYLNKEVWEFTPGN